MIATAIIFAVLVSASPENPASFDGFNNARWGQPPEAVRQATGANGWQPDQAAAAEFPKELNIAVYRSPQEIAGYPANVTYYFQANRFFQATVRFGFDDLKTYDFNYNVYRSVNDYYQAIRNRTLTFVRDIYTLLEKKYGVKRPYFKKLDPKDSFVALDAYLRRERWNLRYHPYDFYQRIVTESYARWDFPNTRVIFSLAISAPDKRFDYTLSLASMKLSPAVLSAIDSLRMRGL